jgi:hypothetical protein
MSTLKFAPWLSDVDVQFYAALANIKINHDKLDDSARKVLVRGATGRALFALDARPDTPECAHIGRVRLRL